MVPQSIPPKVMKVYELIFLKLIKVAVTHWVDHGDVTQRMLYCFEMLIAGLDMIFLQKRESAVLGLRDNHKRSETLATFNFSADDLAAINVLHIIL